MVGLGTQDSLKDAQSFYKRHKHAVVNMLWDSTGQSWSKLGVPAQPAWMLIGKDGKVLASDLGEIPYAEVLKAI